MVATVRITANFWRAGLWASSSVEALTLSRTSLHDALRTFFGTSNETYHVFGRSVGTALSDLFSVGSPISAGSAPAMRFRHHELEPRPIPVTPKGAELQ